MADSSLPPKISEEGEENAVDLPFPPTLSTELFLVKDFDPSTFLLHYQHIPLTDLRSDLRTYLTDLRKRLVDVVDAEWEEFVKIGLGGPMGVLRGSEGQSGRGVVELREELEAALLKLTGAKTELEEMGKKCELMIEERKAVRGKKTYLRLLLSVEEGLGRVERMLIDEKDKQEEEEEGKSARLERIVGEWTRLRYLVGRAEESGKEEMEQAGEKGDIPFVIEMKKQLSRLSTSLLALLSNLLTVLLSTSPRSPMPAFTTANSYFPLSPDPTQSNFPRSTLSSGPSTPGRQGSTPTVTGSGSGEDSLIQCLRCFQSMGEVSVAEEVVRERDSGVRDWVMRNISQESLLRPPSPGVPATPFTPFMGSKVLAPPPSEYFAISMLSPPPRPNTLTTDEDLQITGLCHLYNAVLSYLSSECGRILEVAERKLSGKGGEDEFYILANVLFDEIGKRMMNELGTVIWAPGRPDKFHQNYTLTRNFIDRIESLCPTLRHLQVLRAHPTYVAFHKRWQLPVYFQLRFKEIVVRVEGGIDEGAAPPNEKGVFLKGTLAVYNGVKSCWDPNVYLYDLSHRFWRLSLQLLSRYRTWLDETLPSYLPNTSNAMQRNPTDSPGPARPSTPGLQAQQEEEKKDNNILRQCALVVADAKKLERAVYDLWNRDIREKLPVTERSAAEGALETTVSNILEILPPLTASVLSILSRRCSEAIKNVARMPTQVRSLRRSPTEASTYMGSMTKPLKMFLDVEGRVCDEVTAREWAKKVLEDVISKYAQALVAMRKTDDSLRRLKRGKQQTTSSFFFRSQQKEIQEEEEEDNVRIQMQHDLKYLEDSIEGLGVKLRGMDCDNWITLKRVVEDKDE
ncbi:COG2-domain-containing protein [Atractiella rhizophila]|nr:COG2-domain-containing protein [Atractiella rhizophila]